MGYLARTGIQYHWLNRGYSSFDDFLMSLKQSKRNNIRKVLTLSTLPLAGTLQSCLWPGVRRYPAPVLGVGSMAWHSTSCCV